MQRIYRVAAAAPGGADRLEYEAIDEPFPDPAQVTIDVAFTAVGMVDVLARRGAFGLPFPITPGLSVAGYVRRAGDRVRDLRTGQRVAAFMVPPRFGGYADVVAVDAGLVVSLDSLAAAHDVSLEAAAVGIVNATTAYLAVTTVAQLHPGQAVLVHGGTGALGSMLGQLSRHLGADPVIATVGRGEKIPHALELGYTHAIVRDGFGMAVRELTEGRGLDVVFDTVGGTARDESLAALALLGQLVLLGNSSGGEDSRLSLNSVWLESKGVRGLNLGALSGQSPERFNAAAREALSLIARGVLRADPSMVLPLADAREAHRLLESGRTTGTILLAGLAANRVDS